LESRKEPRPAGWIMYSLALALVIITGLACVVQWNSLQAEVTQSPANLSLVLELSQADLGVDWEQFWAEAGFLVAARAESVSKRVERVGDQELTWEQTLEEWLLVPGEPELNLGRALAQLVADFPIGRQCLFLERDASGYVLGALVKVPGAEQYIPARTWRFVEVTAAQVRAQYEQMAQEENAGAALPPRLAVVVDDWGYDSPAARQLLRYPLPLTIAVLPYLPSSREIALTAAGNGYDVILHQPMEPLDSTQNPGPGAIYLDMEGEAIAEQLRANLQHLPSVVGVNNHMGSRATSDLRVMEHIFGVLREADLFFLDSYTINTSVAGEAAQLSGVPYAVNDLFIDNINDEEYIIQQIRQGIALAKRRGSAVIIGHVRTRTAAALWRMLPEIIESGVMLVPVSALLKTP
jgi:polysaccharide deacetylase 2 family uncharacterized protein YibQ